MMIVHSDEFQQFMDRAGRVMERALSENVDIYTDYTGALDENDIKLVYLKLYINKKNKTNYNYIFNFQRR